MTPAEQFFAAATGTDNRRSRGFTLIELLVVAGTISLLAAIAVPLLNNVVDTMRLRMAIRDVERELQTARLKAVSARRPMRVRFDCPSTGSFRMVELIGTTSAPAEADSAVDRCSDASYPYPSASTNPLVRPTNDGPVRLLQTGSSFTGAQTLEFWPDGTAHANLGGNPWPMIPSTGVAITVTRNSRSQSITVNGVGKVAIQ